MQNKLFYCPVQGGSTLLLILFFCFTSLLGVIGQVPDVCTEVDGCNELSVEVVRVNSQMLSSCSTNTSGCAVDNGNFSQSIYKVYLKYSPYTIPSPLDGFYLGYQELNVALKMKSTGNLSHVDWAASKQLITVWNGSMVALDFVEPEQTVSINFGNYKTEVPAPTSCRGNTGERIFFEWGPPGSECVQECTGPSLTPQCAYAYLMTIVVNAYPGEQIKLEPVEATYVPFETTIGTSCGELPFVTSQASDNLHNGLVLHPTVSTTPAPDTYVGTLNEDLRLSLYSYNDMSGNRKVDLRLTNLNKSTDRTVYYVESVVKAVFMEAELSLSTDPNARILSVTESNNLKSRLLQFAISLPSGITVLKNSGTPVTVATITLGPPPVVNAASRTRFTLVDSLYTRVRSDDGCTSLPLTTTAVVSTTMGDPPCTYSNEIAFFVKADVPAINSECDDPKTVKIGLKNTTSSTVFVQLKYLNFVLKFTGAGVTPGTVTLGDLSFPIGCSSGDCGQGFGGSDPLEFGYNMDLRSGILVKTLSFSPGQERTLEIEFTGNGCIKGATLTQLVMLRNGSGEVECLPDYEVSYNSATYNFPACTPKLEGEIKTEALAGVEDVEVTIEHVTSETCTPSPCNEYIDETDDEGVYTYCTCGTCRKFEVTPFYDVNHLNGVSTYDLVLISKHILGLEALGSPYKIIAADANKSGSITTFDIVELRKLILGIYTVLPANTSWRFVLESFNFTNDANPFGDAFPEFGIIDPLGSPSVYENDFVAIKVGDVNLSAVPNSRPAKRSSVPLSWVDPQLKAGEVVTVPVVYNGSQSLDALQLGLRFDPKVLSLISPSKGDLPGYSESNFGLTELAEGKIRTLWLGNLAEEERIEPGAVLFNLTFRTLSAVPESGLPLQLDDSVLYNAAWQPDGTELAPQREVASARNTSVDNASWQVICMPNPTSGAATIKVLSKEAAKGRISLYGAYGKRLAVREVSVAVGEQEFPLQDLASLPAGVYLWKIEANGNLAQGHIVKQ